MPVLHHKALLSCLAFGASLPVGSLFVCDSLAQAAPSSSLDPGSVNGFIIGRVKNEATNLFLGNAFVQIEGRNLNTLTASDGSFLLSVPSGSYTLVVSYAGLTTSRVEVRVNSGQTLSRDIGLSSTVYALDAFTVQGLREENSLALQAQRYAPNPKTVMATNAYGNASANPGDLLQRVAGVSVDFIAGEATSVYIRGMGADFSTLLVDGQTQASGSSISRAYQIQQWGTANLSQVELVKAPTPDQDANAIAGYINLITKRAFDQPGRRASLSVGTNYTDRELNNSPFKNNAGLDNISLSYSDVYGVLGKEKNLGVRIDASYIRNTVFQEETGSINFALPGAWVDANGPNPLQRVFGAGDYVSPVEQRNLGSNFEYKLSEDSYVFLNLFHNARTQTQEAYRAFFGKSNALAADFTPGSTTAFATLLPSSTVTSDLQSFTSTLRFYNVGGTLGSEHKLFNRSATLSLRANASYAHNENTIFARFNGTARNIGLSFDRRNTDPSEPVMTQTAGPSISVPSSYTVGSLFNTYPKRPDRLIGLRGDFTKNFETAVPTYIKTGLKFNRSERKTLSPIDHYTYVGPDGQVNSGDELMSNFPTTPMYLTSANYGPFPFMQAPFSGRADDPYASKKNQWVQTAADVYNQYNGSLGSNTELSETISAAYISGHVDFGKLRILSGLRVESTEVDGTAWVRNSTATWGGNSVGGASIDPAVKSANLERAKRSFVGQRTASSNYVNVFPGIHFVYEPADGLLARASYNKSISRPPVGNITPTLTENFENRSVSVGNPELKPYYSDNFEVSIEKYFEPVGKLGASVFLKEIKDYFRTFTTILGADGLDGDTRYAGFALTKAQNTGRARIRGFELNYQQEFAFLPGALSGLGTFANYTYTGTLGDFGSLAVSKKLPFLTPRSANAGISYVKYGWAVRAMYNWRSQSYWGTASGVDFYQRERKFIDLKMQYSINKRYDVYFDISNLTNEPNSALLTANGLHWTYLRAGVIYTAGVNARF